GPATVALCAMARISRVPSLRILTRHSHPISCLSRVGLGGFKAFLRSGTTPCGRAVDNEFMPWKSIGAMTDVELEAIYEYLQTLTP
ncbi:MAG: hypothetical protein ACI84D_002999, partial [Thalassolituus oleivorans]